MARTRKLSVSVDAGTFEELKRLVPDVPVSFLIDAALKDELAHGPP